MYAIIDSNKIVVSSCDILPNEEDLAERGLSLVEDSGNLEFDIGDIFNGAEFLKPQKPAAERRAAAKRTIDTAAGSARARYVSAGQLVEEEYRLALQQTQAWRDAGSPADQVPAAIQDWAEVSGMTAEQAAADIEQTAAAWEAVLLQIRQVRLAGKAAVDAAGDADDFAAIAQPFIDQLDAMKP